MQHPTWSHVATLITLVIVAAAGAACDDVPLVDPFASDSAPEDTVPVQQQTVSCPDSSFPSTDTVEFRADSATVSMSWHHRWFTINNFSPDTLLLWVCGDWIGTNLDIQTPSGWERIFSMACALGSVSEDTLHPGGCVISNSPMDPVDSGRYRLVLYPSKPRGTAHYAEFAVP